MPQNDRHRNRIIPIEFNFYDTLETLPYDNRVTLILITNGSATICINNHISILKSPCVLCISKLDDIKILNKINLSSKSLCFDPWFIKACLTFENLIEDCNVDVSQKHNQDMLNLFLNHYDNFQGIFELSPNNYLRMNEVMSLIGAEIYSQSDKFWTCRIRRLLLQCLNNIYDIYVDQRKLKFYEKREQGIVSTCVDYIQTNYNNDIRLEDLCDIVNLNRTSLNERFKEQLNCTAMEYLLNYRIQIACEALAHTNLKLSEIAVSCGFKYDTYFIKQFTNKMNVSPTNYRKDMWSLK